MLNGTMDLAKRRLAGGPAVAVPDGRPLAGRSCDDCAMCCKLMAITELAKPAGQWCPHAVMQCRCAIYEARPPTCRSWHCGYRLMPFLGEHWHPAVCDMVVHWEPSDRQIRIVVAQGSEDRWKRQPYHDDIAMLDHWCLVHDHWLSVNEPDGNWIFDPRGLSDAPLFTTSEEDLLGLGPLPLLKLHSSLMGACQRASDEYSGGYELLRARGLVGLKDHASNSLETGLALGLLYSVGLEIDFDARSLRLAAAPGIGI